MAVAENEIDFGALRKRVRASQHVRSVPLIGIGILLVNYGADLFAPSPVHWRFGAPLVFVGIWAAMKANETLTGVGGRRMDYLIAAGFVFTATNLVLVRPFSRWITDPYRIEGVWVAIVGVALLAVASAATDWLLITAGVAVILIGGISFVRGPNWIGLMEPSPNGFYAQQPLGDVVIAVAGAVMVLAGGFSYRLERRAA